MIEATFLLTAMPKEAGDVALGASWRSDTIQFDPTDRSGMVTEFRGTVVEGDGKRAVFEQELRWRSGERDAWRRIGSGTYTWSDGRIERGTLRFVAPLDIASVFSGEESEPRSIDTARPEEVATFTFVARDP